MPYKLCFCLLTLVLCACDSDIAGQSSEDSATELSGMPLTPVKEVSEELTDGAAKSAGADNPGASKSLADMEKSLSVPVLRGAWRGDLDGMKERRVIRVLTVYGLSRYFLDGVQETGITYEAFKMFEKYVNQKFGNKTLKIHVVFIPVARDQLLSGLIEGRGDIAAAGLTITPERDAVIDFTNPTTRELSEILVTGPSAPRLKSINELAGQEIYLRASSSYRSSIDTLNQRFRNEGLEEIGVRDVSEHLEDEDLLEMVNAGMLDWAIVDSYKAEIWSEVFDGLTVRKDIIFREGGRLAWAFREGSPKLQAALNDFLKSHRQGTLKGNILINRYLKDYDWASNALAANDFSRFEDVVDIFQTYGDRYGFDYLMVTAQGYQESRLDQNAKSHAGAIGIMQLLPTTAADPNVGIPDISRVEPNIHAGVKYLDFIRNRYFNEPEIDDFNQTLFALAAYNMGPARMANVRTRAAEEGYDATKWFDNVEVIAAKQVGREPVQYVANIVKYYVAYRMSTFQETQRAKERGKAGID